MTGSWKTTVLALSAAFFGFVLFTPENFQDFPWLIALAKYAFLGGLGGLGYAAQDANKNKP